MMILTEMTVSTTVCCWTDVCFLNKSMPIIYFYDRFVTFSFRNVHVLCGIVFQRLLVVTKQTKKFDLFAAVIRSLH